MSPLRTLASAWIAVYLTCANLRRTRNGSAGSDASSLIGTGHTGGTVAVSGHAAWGEWRTWLLVDADAAPSTIDEYRYVVWDWLAFLGDKPWQRATKGDLRAYLDRPTRSGRAQGRHLGANTKLHYAATVKAFYAFCHGAGLIGKDPMAAFKLPRGGIPVPRSLSQDQVRQVLLAAQPDERLNLIAWLAYGQACRVGEIAAARIEDVTLGGPLPVITVHGKGRRDRTLPLHRQVKAAIVRTLASQGHPRVGPLVTSRVRPGEPMTPTSVSRQLSQLCHGLGLDASGHALRHSAATEMLTAAKGRNLEDVRQFLGHKDSRTTRIYVARYPWNLEEAVDLIPDPCQFQKEWRP
jgi:integrase